MADRKVINKYHPPDFDPEKLRAKRHLLKQNQSSKRARGAAKQMNVRMMFPFTMCCATCGEFTYIGTKFNSRVERVKGEDYLGIAIWRFYGRCPNCRAEFAFKTDPKNTNYVLEAGGTRTYDQIADAERAESQLKESIQEEVAGDAMKALEHKTYNSANELLALEQLDELRKLNRRFLNTPGTVDGALERMMEREEEDKERIRELTAEDDDDFERAKREMEERRLKQQAEAEQGEAEAPPEPCAAPEAPTEPTPAKANVKRLVGFKVKRQGGATASSDTGESKPHTSLLGAGYDSSD